MLQYIVSITLWSTIDEFTTFIQFYAIMDDLFIVFTDLNLIIAVILSILSQFAFNYRSHFKYILRNDNITNAYRLIMYNELLFPVLIERNEIADSVEMIVTCEHSLIDINTMKKICTNHITLIEQPGNAVKMRETISMAALEEYNEQNFIYNIGNKTKDDFVFEEYAITLQNRKKRIEHLEKTGIISLVFGNTKIDMEVKMKRNDGIDCAGDDTAPSGHGT